MFAVCAWELHTHDRSTEGRIDLSTIESKLREDAAATSAGSKKCDLAWISTERGNVALDPLNSFPLVQNRSIRRTAVLDVTPREKAKSKPKDEQGACKV